MTQVDELITLFILAIPVACVSWTATHEEVFREPREWCAAKSRSAKQFAARKFFYLFTCEYCFSHYVAALCLLLTQYHLLYNDWRGYIIAWFSLVWIANVYMSIFGRVRLEIVEERLKVAQVEAEVEKKK
jgi:hypothetical protein